jgi:hypothetical protein
MYGPATYGLGSPPTHNSSPLNDQQHQQRQQQHQHQHPGQQRPQHPMYNPQAYGAPPQQPTMYDGSGSGAAALGASGDSMAIPPQQDGGGRAHLPGGGMYASRCSPSSGTYVRTCFSTARGILWALSVLLGTLLAGCKVSAYLRRGASLPPSSSARANHQHLKTYN